MLIKVDRIKCEIQKVVEKLKSQDKCLQMKMRNVVKK